jgi:hypothetical protein
MILLEFARFCSCPHASESLKPFAATVRKMYTSSNNEHSPHAKHCAKQGLRVRVRARVRIRVRVRVRV